MAVKKLFSLTPPTVYVLSVFSNRSSLMNDGLDPSAFEIPVYHIAFCNRSSLYYVLSTALVCSLTQRTIANCNIIQTIRSCYIRNQANIGQRIKQTSSIFSRQHKSNNIQQYTGVRPYHIASDTRRLRQYQPYNCWWSMQPSCFTQPRRGRSHLPAWPSADRQQGALRYVIRARSGTTGRYLANTNMPAHRTDTHKSNQPRCVSANILSTA